MVRGAVGEMVRGARHTGTPGPDLDVDLSDGFDRPAASAVRPTWETDEPISRRLPRTDELEQAVLEKVRATIEAIRPAIQADNGDIILHGFDEETGVVTVELIGACVSCPASTVTLKAGVERILKDRIPAVTSVANVGEASESVVTL